MSGISSKLNFDQCYMDQHVSSGVKVANYAQFLDYYVNPNSAVPAAPVCTSFADGTTGCSACPKNEEATMSNGPTHFEKRTDIESCLRGIGRPLSLCSNNKNLMCAGEVTVNPWLCERDITPTNLPKFQ